MPNLATQTGKLGKCQGTITPDPMLLAAAALVALSHVASAWVHPGVFIGDAQLQFVKAQIKAGVQPFAQTFQEALQQLRLQYYRDYLLVVRGCQWEAHPLYLLPPPPPPPTTTPATTTTTTGTRCS